MATMYYAIPTVDVDENMMGQILAARSDIVNAYTNQVRADGTLWINNGVPDVRGIITDWWTKVAGINDAPARYGNSLAKWVQVNLALPVAIPAVTTPPGSPVVIPRTTGGTGVYTDSIPMSSFAWGIGIIVFFLFIVGGRRDKRMQFRTVGNYYGGGGGGGGMRMPSGMVMNPGRRYFFKKAG